MFFFYVIAKKWNLLFFPSWNIKFPNISLLRNTKHVLCAKLHHASFAQNHAVQTLRFFFFNLNLFTLWQIADAIRTFIIVADF